MRWQRGAAEQPHGVPGFLREIPQHLRFRHRDALFRGNESNGSEPAVLHAKGIKLVMAAHKHNGNMRSLRPAEEPNGFVPSHQRSMSYQK